MLLITSMLHVRVPKHLVKFLVALNGQKFSFLDRPFRLSSMTAIVNRPCNKFISKHMFQKDFKTTVLIVFVFLQDNLSPWLQFSTFLTITYTKVESQNRVLFYKYNCLWYKVAIVYKRAKTRSTLILCCFMTIHFTLIYVCGRYSDWRCAWELQNI